LSSGPSAAIEKALLGDFKGVRQRTWRARVLACAATLLILSSFAAFWMAAYAGKKREEAEQQSSMNG
jgi:hypothetical protein